MEEISCEGRGCPLRESCERFRQHKEGTAKLRFSGSPFEPTTYQCDQYLAHYPCRGCICDNCCFKGDCVYENCWTRCKMLGETKKILKCEYKRTVKLPEEN